MEPSYDRSAVGKYNELPALHAITSSAPSAREHRCRSDQRIGQQRPRSCETAPDEAFYPCRRRPKRGITCSMRGSRSSWRGQDDRLRRSTRTHRRVVSIPPWPCTARAERSSAGHPSGAPSKQAKFTLITGSHPGRRQCPSRVSVCVGTTAIGPGRDIRPIQKRVTPQPFCL
jgi:hypothetical protein